MMASERTAPGSDVRPSFFSTINVLGTPDRPPTRESAVDIENAIIGSSVAVAKNHGRFFSVLGQQAVYTVREEIRSVLMS
jgi:hypothetical protein